MKKLENLQDIEYIYEYKVYFYGAGGIGNMLFVYLMEVPFDIEAYCVTYKNDKDSLNGIPIIPIDNIPCKIRNTAAFVLTVDEQFRDELVKNTEVNNIKNVFVLEDTFIKELKEWFNAKQLLRNQMMYPIRKDISLKDKKILIIAPHPDDEVIGCGGMMSLFNDNVDVLCINSSGVWYEWSSGTAKDIAQMREKEFYDVTGKIGIKNRYIARIWGVPPMFARIEKKLCEYRTFTDYEQYDYIFVPHIRDAHREHQYLSNYLLKKILEGKKLKHSLEIGFYEVWSTIEDPNFYLDISDVIEKKIKYINMYISRKQGNYAKYSRSLNNYRGQIGQCEYAEAYKIISIDEYNNLKLTDSWRF